MKKEKKTANEIIREKVETKLRVCKVRAEYHEKMFVKWQSFCSMFEEGLSKYGDDIYSALAYGSEILGDDLNGKEAFKTIFGESFEDLFKGWEILKEDEVNERME